MEHPVHLYLNCRLDMTNLFFFKMIILIGFWTIVRVVFFIGSIIVAVESVYKVSKNIKEIA